MPPISFNEVPNDSLVPFTYVEIDSSRAQQGPTVQQYIASVWGQKLSTGTAPELVPFVATSADEVGLLAGAGSQLHRMSKLWFANNRKNRVEFMPIDDNVGGVDAAGTITFTGTATEAGSGVFYIGGIRLAIAIAVGDTATVVAAALSLANNLAKTEAPATSAAVVGAVTFTSRNAGEAGNDIDLRHKFFEDDADLPAGVTVVIVAMASGANNPDVSEIIGVLPDKHYYVIVSPWTDSANLALLETELDLRFDPVQKKGTVAFMHKRGTLSGLTTFGDGENSKHFSFMGSNDSPTPPSEWAAAIGGVAAREGSRDPGRPFHTLNIVGVRPPAEVKIFTQLERKLLLDDGIATFNVTDSGIATVGRLITAWQTGPGGSPSGAFRDVTTRLTLEYFRFDFASQFQTSFPRHKLADDGTKFGAGQAIVTPKVGRGKAVSIAMGWVELGLMENIDQFKRDLVVERNATDPSRLDFLLPPDVINGLLITAAQIGFLL